MGNASPTVMSCPSPAEPAIIHSYSPERRRREADVTIARLTFSLDGYDVDSGDISYYPNPEYFKFTEDKEYMETILIYVSFAINTDCPKKNYNQTFSINNF